jgi:hypothetical protein
MEALGEDVPEIRAKEAPEDLHQWEAAEAAEFPPTMILFSKELPELHQAAEAAGACGILPATAATAEAVW